VKILLATGGTAGHIEPALNLADYLVAEDAATEVVVVGRAEGLEARLVPARGYRLRTIPAVPMPRKPSKDLVLVPWRVTDSVRRVGAIIAEEKPDVVVGFGGYVAMPTYAAARRAHVPLVIHEANARAGIANKVGARLTRHSAEAVPESLAGARLVGMPLRPSIVHLDRAAMRAEARAHFGLDADRPTLLVFGGSLGAQRLNATMSAAANAVRAAGVQVLHAVGDKRAGLGPIGDGDVPYVTLDYIDRMDLAYAAADLAVSRAGAMTCAELAAVGLPAVYVPLPVGNGEQALNAAPVVSAGGGLLVDDAAFTPDVITGTVLPLLTDAGRLSAMGEAASTYGIRDGSERLAALVIEAVEAQR